MGRIPIAGKETIQALLDLGGRQAPHYVQKPTVDGGYVLRKPDHGIIIIQEKKPRTGCVYDEYNGSILDKIQCVIHCTARIGVKSARSCCGLINDYDFIFAVTDYEKFVNLVDSGREDFDWLIYNTYVDARNDDWHLTKTPYPAAIDFTKWELVIGDRIRNPGPMLKEYCETQAEFYRSAKEEMERNDAAAREPRGRQFQGTVEDFLSYLSSFFDCDLSFIYSWV
ncbi:hypothetical protein MKX08_006696 [Trichoderma sp. CBMAI-0020]|nr:hypothetical protein MKX08_006696 [Trichoderma sp. CBMAI-0020]